MSRLPPIRRFCLLGLVFTCLVGCATGSHPGLAWSAAQSQPLEAWLESDLEPYLAEKLTAHPRFKGESITVVNMQGDELQPAPDALSAALARRITEFLLASGGVNLVWDGARAAGDCTRREDAHYTLAVDLQQTSPASHRLNIRALDREDGLWVSGFGRQWDGRLSRTEYASFKQRGLSGTTRGLRDDPFPATETDLLAASLATKLGERFCGFVGEPLIVYAHAPDDSPSIVSDTVNLVANNLARSPHIRIVQEPEGANLILSGRLYAIDEPLHQLWVQARPAGDAANFAVTDVEAYLELPGSGRESRAVIAAAASGSPGIGLSGTGVRHDIGPADSVSVTALRVLTPNDPWMCRRADPWRRGARLLRPDENLDTHACFALEIEVRGDAELFLLRRDTSAGIVRLVPGHCGRRGRVPSRVDGEGTLRFPSPEAGRADALTPPSGMRDQWIALAVPAADGDSAFRRHLSRLPDRCAASDGASIDADVWLRELRSLTARYPSGAHMRILEISVGRQTAAVD